MPSRLALYARSQGFTFALFASILAAALWPELGASGGPLRAETATKWAVALTFLIQGLSLPTRHILRAASQAKLHLYCQLMNFVASPLLMLAFLLVFGTWTLPELRFGYLYLSFLPTTISSAILLTANCDGNSSAALFSTTLSNLLALFATPLLCAYFIASGGDGPSVLSLLGKLSLLVLLPLMIGQAIRPLAREWAQRGTRGFKRASNALILFVVFASFCDSVQQGVWAKVGPSAAVATLALVATFLLLLSALVWLTAPIVAAHPADRIAAFFCGSQKSLATGIPMANVIFGHLQAEGSAWIGLVILPIICYHPLQLLLGGAVAPYLARSVRNGARH